MERNPQHTMVGCGLNLWWPEPPGGVGSIFTSDPGPEVGVWISQGWADELVANGAVWDRADYLAACSTVGQSITWDPDGLGRAIDIDADGGLVVKTVAGTETLRSGEVRTIRQD